MRILLSMFINKTYAATHWIRFQPGRVFVKSISDQKIHWLSIKIQYARKEVTFVTVSLTFIVSIGYSMSEWLADKLSSY